MSRYQPQYVNLSILTRNGNENKSCGSFSVFQSLFRIQFSFNIRPHNVHRNVELKAVREEYCGCHYSSDALSQPINNVENFNIYNPRIVKAIIHLSYLSYTTEIMRINVTLIQVKVKKNEFNHRHTYIHLNTNKHNLRVRNCNL